MTRCWKVLLWVKLYLWSLYPSNLWQISAHWTNQSCTEHNKCCCFFFFMHKVFQLVRLSFQTIVMFFHHLSCFLCAPLYTRCILSFVFPLAAASLWFEVASRCRTALLWLESTSPSRSTQSTGTLSADKTGGKDTHRADVHKRWLYAFFPSCTSLIPLSLDSVVLTWWPWVPCQWPWCSSVHRSCPRQEPSGRRTTTSWSWIRWPCPERKFSSLNVTSGVFWAPTRWCCLTLSPDTRRHAWRRVQRCLSFRCKTLLQLLNLYLCDDVRLPPVTGSERAVTQFVAAQ